MVDPAICGSSFFQSEGRMPRSHQGKGEQMTTATLNETNEQTSVAASRNTDRRKATMGTWIGRVMSGLVVAFMLMASVFPKLFLPELATETMRQLGWNPKHVLVIAVLELVGTLLYAIPRTAALGAVLLTGVFGGAIATHLRIENPLFSHTVFPLYVGFLMWGGLWLRSARVRALLPLWGGNERARNNAERT
jgi:uncharacterized membrane protein YphA (DoxX/SURF4 family)